MRDVAVSLPRFRCPPERRQQRKSSGRNFSGAGIPAGTAPDSAGRSSQLARKLEVTTEHQVPAERCVAPNSRFQPQRPPPVKSTEDTWLGCGAAPVDLSPSNTSSTGTVAPPPEGSLGARGSWARMRMLFRRHRRHPRRGICQQTGRAWKRSAHGAGRPCTLTPQLEQGRRDSVPPADAGRTRRSSWRVEAGPGRRLALLASRAPR